MIVLDVPEACLPQNDIPVDVAPTGRPMDTPLQTRRVIAPLSYALSLKCPAWISPEEAPFYPVQMSGSQGAVADAGSLPEPVSDPMPGPEDLMRGDKDPRQVLTRMLQIENRPAGLRALGTALGILQQQLAQAEIQAGSSPAYFRAVGARATGLQAADPKAAKGEGTPSEAGSSLQVAEARLAVLESLAVELANPTELMQTLERLPGAPQSKARNDESARIAPRKRDLTGQGMESRAVALAVEPEVPADLEAVRQRDIIAYTRTLLDFGRLYSKVGNMPATYQLLSSAMRSHYNTWLQQAPQLSEEFQRAAVFQALSAQRAADVVTLYDQLPLDRQDLSRRVVAQIEGRLNAYGAARSEFTRQPDLAAAIGDLLHTLVEDPDLPRLIPRDDYQRVLKKYARVALDRQFFSEAIGALAAAGDTRQLQHLGEKWSRNIIQRRGDVWIVSRDVELGIQAYTEARDFNALRSLLERCRQAKVQLASLTGNVDGVPFLDRNIDRLSNLLEGERALQLSRS